MSEIQGETGFKEQVKKDEIMDKEEAMFRIGVDGKALPEKRSIEIYDRTIDVELIDESLLLMTTLKRKKAIDKAILKARTKEETEIQVLKSKIEKETDTKIKLQLTKELNNKQSILDTEAVKTSINTEIINDSIIECRELIKGLKELKSKQMVIKFAEIIPCNSAESYLAFEKGKTVEGKDTNDWISDLISKNVANPKFSLDEAKKLKLDYKIGLKEAIMVASGYKLKNYKDIMLQKKLEEEKPLLLKKGEPIA